MYSSRLYLFLLVTLCMDVTPSSMHKHNFCIQHHAKMFILIVLKFLGEESETSLYSPFINLQIATLLGSCIFLPSTSKFSFRLFTLYCDRGGSKVLDKRWCMIHEQIWKRRRQYIFYVFWYCIGTSLLKNI